MAVGSSELAANALFLSLATVPSSCLFPPNWVVHLRFQAEAGLTVHTALSEMMLPDYLAD